MTTRTPVLWTAVLGMWMAPSLQAQEPPRLDKISSPLLSPLPPLSENQRLADQIARQLRQSGQLKGYLIHVSYQNGAAELSGTVADQAQREEALRLVQGIPGVERVRDLMTVGATQQLKLTQGEGPVIAAPPPTTPPAGDRPDDRGPGAPPPAIPGERGPEPFPIFQAAPPASAGAQADLNPPKMPPYAWPTYAPYNNVSRVGYPSLYPYNAWPYIGPVYPFPKVPLGWRKITLSWEDGHWWYGKNASGHDWWRLRYW